MDLRHVHLFRQWASHGSGEQLILKQQTGHLGCVLRVDDIPFKRGLTGLVCEGITHLRASFLERWARICTGQEQASSLLAQNQTTSCHKGGFNHAIIAIFSLQKTGKQRESHPSLISDSTAKCL